jgi:hypothetical protein
LAVAAVQGEFAETRLSIDSFLRLVIPSFSAHFRLEVEIRNWNARRLIHCGGLSGLRAVTVETMLNGSQRQSKDKRVKYSGKRFLAFYQRRERR